MKHLVVAALTLTAIVAGILVATSLSSSAQEDEGPTSTTTTTGPAPDQLDHFEFRFGGDLPPEFDEFLSCLEGEGIDVPDEPDGSFMFNLHTEDIEGLAEALEACGLPRVGPRFGEDFSFGDELPEGFPFSGEFPEGFPFGDEFPEGFRFGEGFGPGDGFGLEFRLHGIDRDELASCLAELGSFDSVDQIREKLDECLPEPADLEDLEGFVPFGGGGRNSDGHPFGGGFFGFQFEAPESDLDGASA